MRPIPDITLRDLCRWDRRLRVLPPAGVDLETTLDRPVSWAVSVRAAPPLLPPLRGDELVVLPLRVMSQIESDANIDRPDLLTMLAQQKIAAILTDPEFSEDPLPGLPALILPAPFPHDAEGTLNRLITERRAELYRLGNELSRRLSQAALDPRGVDALLDTAAAVAGRSLVLQDVDGNVVGWGGAETIRPADPAELAAARRDVGPRILPGADGTHRLITALPAGSQTGYLSMLGGAGSFTEIDRLVLSQTAGTCAVMLGQGHGLGLERGGRQHLVADLLLGRLASKAAASARGQALGIEPAQPVVVGLISAPGGTTAARQIVQRALGRRTADNVVGVPGGAGVLIAAADPRAPADALRSALADDRHDGVGIALSPAIPTVVQAPDGLRQARFALDLWRAGAIAGPVISADAVTEMGIYSLLYPLWGTPTVEHFRSALLGDLEAYDQTHHSELIPTLEAYLSRGGALHEAAAALGIHRNTLSYRLQRIADVTGRDLTSPRDRLLLQVALLIRHLPPMD